MRAVPPQFVEEFVKRVFPKDYAFYFEQSDADPDYDPCKAWSGDAPLDEDSAPLVAQLLDLLSSLKLRPVELDDEVSLQIIEKHLEFALGTYRKTPVQKGIGPIGIPAKEAYPTVSFRFLGAREYENHIVRKLVPILRNCPDRLPSSLPEAFGVVSDLAYRTHLLQDLKEVQDSLNVANWKSAMVIGGSLVEALLFYCIHKIDQDDPQRFATACQGVNLDPGKLPRFTLEMLGNVGLRLSLIDDGLKAQVDQIRGFRNLVHPGKSHREQEYPSRGKAYNVYGVLLLLEETLRARCPSV